MQINESALFLLEELNHQLSLKAHNSQDSEEDYYASE
jgi:hypothetical protein